MRLSQSLGLMVIAGIGCSSSKVLPDGSGGSGGASATDAPIASMGGTGGSSDDGGGVETGAESPELNVSPVLVPFGTVEVGSKSPEPQPVVTVTNAGTADIALALTVAGAGFAIERTTCAATLAVGAACTITLSFAPTMVGVASGSLTVVAGRTVSLSGIGWDPKPLSIFGDRVDLGPVALGVRVPVAVRCEPPQTVTGVICTAQGEDLTADLANTTCGTTVAANSPCVVAFVFKSSTLGPKSDSVVCAAGGKVFTVPVTATVVTNGSPTISPAAPEIVAAVGETQTVVLEVANVGGSATGALTAVLSPATATELTIASNDCTVPLAALSVCKITIAFKPTTPGTKTATLTVTDALAPTISATAIITGRADYPDGPAISGNPDLGSVLLGTSGSPVVYTMKNMGGQAASGLTLASTDPLQFRIGNDTCSGQPLPANGGSCTFTVTFAPAATATPGVLNAVLQVFAEVHGASNLAIKGTAIKPPTLTITPTPLAFDGIALNTQSGEKRLTITNTGSLSTGVLTFPSDLGDGFVISGNTCTAALQATESCSIAIKFAPKIIAQVTFTFTVSSASGAVATALITGSGRAPTPLVLDPRDVRGCSEPPPDGGVALSTCFADTAVGQTDGASPNKPSRAPMAFTVTYVATSIGGSSIPTGDVTVSLGGANASDFVIATSACGPSLVPNQSCTFTVSFKPTAVGLRKATITATSTNGGNVSTAIEAIGLPVDSGG
jgi:hypothetical protein